MKNKLFILVFFLLIISISTISADSWMVGDRCLANWSYDDYWYPGTIVDTDKDSFFIQFDDGDTEWLGAGSLIVEDLVVGDYVEANWQLYGIYYTGYIAERNGDEIYIEYDDGDVEWTTVSAVRIYFY